MRVIGRCAQAFRHSELAIIYNQPDVLSKRLCYIHPLGAKKAKQLYEFSEALERNQCKLILAKHGISFETLHVSKERKLN